MSDALSKLYGAFAAKGDVPGHEFHGNQYGGGGGKDTRLTVRAHDASMAAHNNVRAVIAGNKGVGRTEYNSQLGAATKSHLAEEATAQAQTFGGHAQHTMAADAHEAAGRAHGYLGNEDIQRQHYALADEHRAAARAYPAKDDSARDLIKAAKPMALPGPTFNPFTKAQEPPPNVFMTKKD
jgi:hypothetical protein